jgi:hypothetical protein
MRNVTRRILLAMIAATALWGVTVTGFASAASAAGTPEWAVMSVAGPTNLVAGGTEDAYIVTATNVGGAASDGSLVSISDKLPAALTATNVSAIDTGRREELPCEINTVVRCVDFGVVIPGDVIQMTVTMNVSATPPASLVNEVHVTGGGAASATADSSSPTGLAPATFGIVDNHVTTAVSNSQAGGHPNFTTAFAFNQQEAQKPAENAKQINVDLPPGLIGDPTATPQCTVGQVVAETCTPNTAVGLATVIIERGEFSSLIYNIKPDAGEPAAFAFTAVGYPVRLDAGLVRRHGQYNLHVTVGNVNETVRVLMTSVTFWGVPQEFNGPGPDEAVGGVSNFHFGGPGGGSRLPLMRNPTNCDQPLSIGISSESWENPGANVNAESVLGASGGCDLLNFDPSLSVATDNSQAGAPAGYEIDLHTAQNDNADALGDSDLRNAVLTLPAGTVVSPSAADGLQGCSDEAGSPAGDQFGAESTALASCPQASQIGTVKIETPLLPKPLEGQVFLGQPDCSPCSAADAQDGRMLRLMVQAAGSGVVVKLRGSVSVNQTTGQLTTTFADNPQVPFEDFRLRFNGGARAPLENPQTCGAARTTSELSPWSSPLTPDATPSSEFQVEGCGVPRFSPSFNAGTVNNQADVFSPFSVTFSRTDQDQDLSAVQVITPPGLLGMLSQVPLCPEPQASQGTCGPQSLIGHTTVGAGVGTNPIYVSGQVFLTGPYKGAPFGLSIVVPAVAGPFNLGTVVVRATINVDPNTTALTITSDPLPTIIDGIPLHMKTINVTADRAGFMFNPTNCSALAIHAVATSTQGATAAMQTHFQAANCAALPFKPKFSASSKAKTSRAYGASLDVKVGYPRGAYANIRSVAVSLPKQLPSRLTTIQQACVSRVFTINPAMCPAGSAVGVAKAVSPVLPGSLTGPVYLVSHGGAAFPDLVVILQGDGVRIDLTGAINISKKGITSSDFASVPDAPISSFELNLPQGRHSALTANGSVCALSLVMPTTITAQNGAVLKQSTKIKVTGCPKAKAKKKPKKKATKSSHISAGNRRVK